MMIHAYGLVQALMGSRHRPMQGCPRLSPTAVQVAGMDRHAGAVTLLGRQLDLDGIAHAQRSAGAYRDAQPNAGGGSLQRRGPRWLGVRALAHVHHAGICAHFADPDRRARIMGIGAGQNSATMPPPCRRAGALHPSCAALSIRLQNARAPTSASGSRAPMILARVGAMARMSIRPRSRPRGTSGPITMKVASISP